MSYTKPAIKCQRMIVRTATPKAARIYTAIAEHPNSRRRPIVGQFYQFEDENPFNDQ